MYSQSYCVKCKLITLTTIHINAVYCSVWLVHARLGGAYLCECVHSKITMAGDVVPYYTVRLAVNISSRQRLKWKLLRSFVLTSNQPTSNICLHSNQLGYHMFGLPWPRLKHPGPVSIMWNWTTEKYQAHVACCRTGTLVHWDSTQTDWPGSVFDDSVSIPGWISHVYLKYANF